LVATRLTLDSAPPCDDALIIPAMAPHPQARALPYKKI